MAFLVWTPNGAFEVLARFTLGELVIGLVLVVLVVVQLVSWWQAKVDSWADGM